MFIFGDSLASSLVGLGVMFPAFCHHMYRTITFTEEIRRIQLYVDWITEVEHGIVPEDVFGILEERKTLDRKCMSQFPSLLSQHSPNSMTDGKAGLCVLPYSWFLPTMQDVVRDKAPIGITIFGVLGALLYVAMWRVWLKPRRVQAAGIDSGDEQDLRTT